VSISFAVQAEPSSRNEWLALAQRAEELGFEALTIPDHPGITASPFVALAAAAQVTSRLLLAPAVINAGAWEPLALAAEVATLDLVSDGRAVLGIGAGHTPNEWTQVGRSYPPPKDRLAHLETVVTAVRRLLAGERVTIDYGAVHLRDAALEWPARSDSAVPILIGGNARELVAIAARHADVLELTGLGRTLPDGHAHRPLWSAKSIDGRIAVLHVAGRPSVRRGVLVQNVEVAADRTGAAEAYRARLATVLPDEHVPSIIEVLDTPYVLIGTEQQIAEQLRANHSRWGLSRYTVRADSVTAVGAIIERLA
jgi:probable F420-dependent oxidoreductase